MGKSSSAPSPDPNIGAAALQNAAIGKEALEWYKKQYADLQPYIKRTQQQSVDSASLQNDIAQQNFQNAQDQYGYYKGTFQPVEQQTVADAMNYDSQDRQDQMAGKAAADVDNSFASQRAQTNRNLTSMGVDPSSGRFAAAQRSMDIQQAAAKAGAMTNARQSTIDKGIALRTGVANFGRNMPNTATAGFGTSIAAGTASVNSLGAGINATNSGASLMGQGYGTAMQGNTSMANILNQQYQSQLQGWGAQQQADAAMIGGIAQAAGTYYGMKK